MGLFDKFFGNKPATPPPPPKGIYDLKLGGAVAIDDFDFKLLADELLIAFPGKTQMIEAVGHMDLGAGSHIKRYYTSDDAYFQVNYTGEEAEHNLEDFKLFRYDKSITLGRNSEWERWLKPETIGPQTYQYRDKQYTRVFGDGETAIPPVAISEQVSNKAGDRYQIDNFFMLFQREVKTDIFEYLLINGEESDEGNLITLSLGVDLSALQINVIG